MRLSTITWLAALIISVYWLTNLACAYHTAIYAWQDARNSKAYSILLESK